jgi:hypothetical protein
LAAIEAATLLKRAKAIVPRVSERAMESLEGHVKLAEEHGDPECLRIYREALEEALRAKNL